MTWMITVARNLAIDSVRKSARESYADDAELLALPSDSPSAVENLEAAEEHSEAIEQRQKMLRALQALDPLRRDLIIAAYLHGESRAQLAKRAGVPVNTVKTWIRRSVLEIQQILRNTETRPAGGCGRAHPASRGGPGVVRTATSPPRASAARTAASAV
jgi:RNA polymerase sigma-70 factor (ECF subfamily)